MVAITIGTARPDDDNTIVKHDCGHMNYHWSVLYISKMIEIDELIIILFMSL